MIRRFLPLLSCTLFGAFYCAFGQNSMAGRTPNRMLLWHIVHDECVPEQEGHLAGTAHCVYVNLDRHYAILKDTNGVAQLLLLPTDLISGIESPAILAPGVSNFFAEAWDSRTYLTPFLHRTLPREYVSLAVNSLPGRTQDTFHIHIDCVREDVAEQIREHADSIGKKWAPFDPPLMGHSYMAMRIDGAELKVNPVKLLADELPGAREDMANRTLVLVGAKFPHGRPGFVLFEDHASGSDKASGEELQDHSCAIAHSNSQ